MAEDNGEVLNADTNNIKPAVLIVGGLGKGFLPFILLIALNTHPSIPPLYPSETLPATARFLPPSDLNSATLID